MTKRLKTTPESTGAKAEQANSDPLPYTQVDRAVKPKATLLAAMMGSTTQHALGSLVEFWDLNGDPRELEQLIAAGKSQIVLAKEVVHRRFKLASGHDVDPEDLEALGLLERIGESFRVRGMSRYFTPVERRLQARAAAAAGGKASVKVRKEKFGTAQPRSGNRSESVRTPLERLPNDSRSAAEATTEASLEANAEATSNTAVSGQRSSFEEVPPQLDGAAEKRPRRTSKPSRQQETFAWMQAQARERMPGRTDEPVASEDINFLLRTPLDKVGREGLQLAWVKFLSDSYATRAGWPLRLFVSQWPNYHNAALAAAPPSTEADPKVLRIR